MTAKTRGLLSRQAASERAETKRGEKGITYIQGICDICGKPRNTLKHRKQAKCSKLRQQMYRRAS